MTAKNTDKAMRRVLCYGCAKPIHVNDFGGIVKTEKGDAYTHSNIVCLLAFNELIKPPPPRKEKNDD